MVSACFCVTMLRLQFTIMRFFVFHVSLCPCCAFEVLLYAGSITVSGVQVIFQLRVCE
mgnify:CR=1 FL=1